MEQFNSNDPLAHLRSSMLAIEQACSAIQVHMNPTAAESTILALRQSPSPYQLCQFILENSQLPNARFQAAGAICDAALREWSILKPEDKKNLISFCLCYPMQHASSPDGYVQVKVCAVGAQLLKKGWMEFAAAERDAFFVEIEKSIASNYGVDAQFMGLNFLESLVSEFASSISTSMGLSAEIYQQCQSSLEVNYLQIFYSWAQNSLINVSSKVVEGFANASELKVCSAALRLMFQILNWNFQCVSSEVKSVLSRRQVSMSRPTCGLMTFKKYEHILVQPGPAWRDVLISSGHVSWILRFYGTVRSKFAHDNGWFDSPVAVSARQFIMQLCSLTGTIFSPEGELSQDSHLLQLLSEVVHWISPPEAVVAAIKCGKSESELLDGCRALLSIANMVRLTILDKLLKSFCQFDTVSLLSALTCEVVKAKSDQAAEEDTWSSEALDILLDAWNVFLVAPPSKGADDLNKSILSSEGRATAAMVFGVLVDSELKAAGKSVYDEGDDTEHFKASISARDDKLSSYALIARVAADFSIPYLMAQLSERFSLLHQMQKGQQIGDPTCILEELYWLLLVTGHVLADTGDGETPLVPEALQVESWTALDATNHPVILLSGSIINFCEQSLNPESRSAFFSPRLMEAVIWFLGRWANTYLMPPEFKAYNLASGHEGGLSQMSSGPCKALLSFFGEHNQGKQVLDVIVRVALTSLLSYSGENDLQALTCRQLLPSLVRRKNVCTHLIALESWRNFACEFANERNFYSLGPSLQRSITESLCCSVSAMASEEANQLVKNLMGQVSSYLLDISMKKDIKSIADQPDAILMVSCLLERLRGAARATQPRNQRAIFEVGVAAMKPLLLLLEVYKNQSAVIYKLLKFVVDWVDGQVVFLEAKDTAVLVDFCMQLFQIYSSHNIGKISLSISSSILREEKTEKYKDLRALLQLLANLCSKDLVDFSSSSELGNEIDIGQVTVTGYVQVVYLGLHIVTPLISVDLLKYPKLCRDYFTLLSHLLEVYPEKVAQLNSQGFEHLIGTLDFGVRHEDADVVTNCLSALNALASFHYSERSGGKEGLGAYAAGFRDPSGNMQRGILSHFLHSLLHLLVFENYRGDLVASAADALLPLLLCEHNEYQQWCKDVIERQTDPVLQQRLANAIQALTSSNQVSSTLYRVNRRRFRANLETFLNDVCGFLRTF